MIRIEIKDGENIERALKRYKRKYRQTKILEQIKAKKEYKKPSIENREKLQKAKYREAYLREENE